eukprot:SAG31_NODE_3497_length_4195_cov_5.065430_5_plen_106_part_00
MRSEPQVRYSHQLMCCIVPAQSEQPSRPYDPAAERRFIELMRENRKLVKEVRTRLIDCGFFFMLHAVYRSFDAGTNRALDYEQVEGDGNCMFRSIADQVPSLHAA